MPARSLYLVKVVKTVVKKKVDGVLNLRYDYIWKGDIDEDDYPEDACDPRYHGNAQIDNLQVNQQLTATTQVSAAGVTLTSRKPFDIPHPTKDGYRLRHVCLEGPESGVYYRGRAYWW